MQRDIDRWHQSRPACWQEGRNRRCVQPGRPKLDPLSSYVPSTESASRPHLQAASPAPQSLCTHRAHHILRYPNLEHGRTKRFPRFKVLKRCGNTRTRTRARGHRDTGTWVGGLAGRRGMLAGGSDREPLPGLFKSRWFVKSLVRWVSNSDSDSLYPGDDEGKAVRAGGFADFQCGLRVIN